MGSYRSSSMTLFEDIRIIDFDLEMTKLSTTSPSLHHIYLCLSHSPPSEWIKLFEIQKFYSKYKIKHPAWVEGNYIGVECIPEKLETSHLSELRQAVANTNQVYREHQTKIQEGLKQQNKLNKKRKIDLKGLRNN
jgi:hypothetical protein